MSNPVFFKAGEEVPEWLLLVTPQKPTEFRPSITFDVDCVVVDVAGSYWVLPLGGGDSVMSVTDCTTALTEIERASKTVRIVIRQQVVGGDDGDDDAETPPIVPLVPVVEPQL
jgi:hypothetical protein